MYSPTNHHPTHHTTPHHTTPHHTTPSPQLEAHGGGVFVCFYDDTFLKAESVKKEVEALMKDKANAGASSNSRARTPDPRSNTPRSPTPMKRSVSNSNVLSSNSNTTPRSKSPGRQPSSVVEKKRVKNAKDQLRKAIEVRHQR